MDKCDEDKDKTHEANSDMKVSNILKQVNGKVMHTDAPLTYFVELS